MSFHPRAGMSEGDVAPPRSSRSGAKSTAEALSFGSACNGGSISLVDASRSTTNAAASSPSVAAKLQPFKSPFRRAVSLSYMTFSAKANRLGYSRVPQKAPDHRRQSYKGDALTLRDQREVWLTYHSR